MSTNEIRMPVKGRKKEEILREMKSYGSADPDYKKLKTWSLVYYLGEEYTNFLIKAHSLYFSTNGLNPMAFKSLKRFEFEVVRMTIAMLNGDKDAVGTMTSGGTESCMLAVKTYRDYARSKKPWILRPNIVVPETAHVAWYKGAEYFDLKVVLAPLKKDSTVNVKAMKKLINHNTVMILGSAPNYPHGIVEPIAELGEIAKKKNIPMHVDACIGGYMLPFVEKAGYPVPTWDFRVPGVTSISADTHKYGFAAKGASVIMYRNADYLKHQLFAYEKWPGGIFASPAFLGTRPGGSIAAAWAAMQAMGEDGYLKNAKKAMETTKRLMDGINAIPELEVVGKPHMTIFAFKSKSREVGIFAVGDLLEKKGWNIDRQQRPDTLHAMVTPLHWDIIDEYLADIKEAVAVVKKNPELNLKGGAAMYGMISAVPLRGMIKKTVLNMMLDSYKADGKQIDPNAAETSPDMAMKAAIAFLKLKDKVAKFREGK